MTIVAILLPVFVLVLLPFILAFWLGFARRDALASGAVASEDVALKKVQWPEQAEKIGQSFSNQFEAPVLFYFLVALAIMTHKADLLFVVMEWLFVILRLVHAGIHTGPNKIQWRGAAFGLSFCILLAMWLIFAIRILLS